MTNKQKKWNNKIETLASMKGSYETKRTRALHQMNMSGDEWVLAKDQIGLMERDVPEEDIISTRSKFFNPKKKGKKRSRKPRKS